MMHSQSRVGFDCPDGLVMIEVWSGELNVVELKLSASSLDLRPLYYFVHVASSGSFSRAAAALSVGQPIISRAIRGLEEDLQVILLHRHGRGVSLTPAGEQLLTHGQAILRQLADTRNAIAALGDVAAGMVDITMPPLLGELVAIELLKRMRADYPLISVYPRGLCCRCPGMAEHRHHRYRAGVQRSENHHLARSARFRRRNPAGRRAG
jgi:hypothetical protein